MKWEPIETAPEGVMTLFCSMKTQDVFNWCYVDWVVNGGLMIHKSWSATHWMPLPEPPNAKLSGTETEPTTKRDD